MAIWGLEPERAVRAVEALTDETRTLKRYAGFKMFCIRRTVCSKEADDLHQEAVLRTLDGRRNWSPHVDFETHLKGAMRSIAHEWLEESSKDLEAADYLHSGITANRRDGSTERAQNIIRRTFLLLQDDAVALGVLDALLDGKRPLEIRQLLAIDAKLYNAARRRIRRCAQQASVSAMLGCSHDTFSRRASQSASVSA